MKETLAKLLEQIAPEIDLDDLEPDENFREALDLDSFDFLRLMESIEKELGITVAESEYVNFSTLESALDFLREKARV